jgi:putative ABC transport system permease protein
MRTVDIVRLGAGALSRRKLRSALPVVGVAVGSFVLIASLSIGQGIQGVILRQLRKQDQLRQIWVWHGRGVRPRDVPASELDVKGQMSEARRRRLREAIARRWQPKEARPGQGLRESQIAEMEKLDGVESVTPILIWLGKAAYQGRSVPGTIRVASAADRGIARRVVAGAPLGPGDGEGVLVSEYLLYRWGIVNEADAGSVIGRRVRLEIPLGPAGVGTLLQLLSVARPDMTKEEARVLARLLPRLPAALAAMPLPEKDREVLKRILSESHPGKGGVVVREVPIRGVFRDVERDELSPWDGPIRAVDVYIPASVGRGIFYVRPERRQTGLPQVSVRVRTEDDLAPVEERIKAMGLETFSLATVLEQLRLTVRLVVAACVLLALVALLVAALGISNTMLMSVLERTHEIGVMKAVGARSGQLLLIFLVEGLAIGVVGGLAGLAAAWLLSYPGDALARHLVESRLPMRLDESVFDFPAWLTVGAPVLVCLLSTLAAVVPARRAAGIDPIEALRQR